MTHFKNKFPGTVVEWDVVNEAVTRGLGVWGKIGDNATVAMLAFQWAHEADPNAKLYYNDYSNEALNTKTSNAVYSFVTGLKQAGVPIDGVGMQAHFTTRAPGYDSMKANLNKFAGAGFETKFTELDVQIQNTSTRNLKVQAAIYEDVVQACLDATGCTGVLTWGLTDKYSWIVNKFPLPFDTTHNPKPAYSAMQEVLSSSL